MTYAPYDPKGLGGARSQPGTKILSFSKFWFSDPKVRPDPVFGPTAGEYVVQSGRIFGAWASGHWTSKQVQGRKTTGPIT